MSFLIVHFYLQIYFYFHQRSFNDLSKFKTFLTNRRYEDHIYLFCLLLKINIIFRRFSFKIYLILKNVRFFPKYVRLKIDGNIFQYSCIFQSILRDVKLSLILVLMVCYYFLCFYTFYYVILSAIRCVCVY